MKKIICLLLCVVTAFSAQAWSKDADQGVRLFAKQNLTPTALKEYNKLLRLTKQYPREKVAIPTDERWNVTSLDADLHSTTTYEGDIVVQLERAANVLRNRANHSDKEKVDALRAIWNNMIRLHNIASVRIEGNEKSKGFTIYSHPGVMAESDPKVKTTKTTWARLWSQNLTTSLYGFTPKMYVEELTISHGADKEAFSVGTIRDWATDMGKECAAQLEWAEPEMKIYTIDKIALNPVTNRLMAKSGYRLAALLNEVLQ